jgi:hypothetical protein
MSFELTGKLIVAEATQQITDTFKKREFVIEVVETAGEREFTNYPKFQLTQDKCDKLDLFPLGCEITVSFNVRGNKWEKDGKTNYFTSLQAWNIKGTEVVDNPAPTQEEANTDDLPF